MQGLSGACLEAIEDKLPVAPCAFTAEYLGAAIAFVAEQWMPYMFHVGTYLMGAACFQYAFNQRYISEALQYLVMGYCRLAYI